MRKGNSQTAHEKMLAALKEHAPDYTVDDSPKARRVLISTSLQYSVPGTEIAYHLAGKAEFVYNADGSLRSADFKLKPREET